MVKGDERVLWQRKAALSQSSGAVRGTLHVTSERLVHIPSRLARKGRGETREWPLTDVRSVSGIRSRDHTYYRDVSPHGGSMRKRLHVRLSDGQTLVFSVEQRDQAVEELQAIVAEGAPHSGVPR